MNRRNNIIVDVDDYYDDEIPTIRVIAPKRLQEGCTFEQYVNHELFTVHVPKGGVKQGQEFDVLYDRKETQTIDGQDTAPVETMSSSEEEEAEKEDDASWSDETTGAPIGRWRNSLCSCCDVLTQSTFWMAWCCSPVFIAQLITRLGLTWNGQPGATPEVASLSFNRIVLSMMITLAIWKIPLLGGCAFIAFWIIIVGYVGSSVRKYVRQKYKIPPTLPTRCGHRIDDGCCMLFCGCCAAIQMARHTHDDKEFPGHGCTTTGLGWDATKIV